MVALYAPMPSRYALEIGSNRRRAKRGEGNRVGTRELEPRLELKSLVCFALFLLQAVAFEERKNFFFFSLRLKNHALRARGLSNLPSSEIRNNTKSKKTPFFSAYH